MKIYPMNGDTAVAYALKQINPDVVAGYPITPQTIAIERFSEYVANGEVDTELVLTESEHSAMSACIGASAAGGRVMTSTASAGLALMWEMLYVAASNRLPIVMNVMNRALSAPINIHCDHSDSMGARDSGWIQMHAENVQEGYDNLIQAVRIAEDKNIRLPVMTCFDGFIISHAVERVEVLDDDTVKKFIGERKPEYPLLDTSNPVTYGPFDLYDYYMEHKKQQHEAMKKVKRVIMEVSREYEKLTGRKYNMIEEYKMDDANICVISLGSTAGTVKEVVNKLRANGVKAGSVKIHVFRPFPVEELIRIGGNIEAIAVMDRSDSFGSFGGPVFTEVRNALYKSSDAEIVNYIYGLGGRDVTTELIEKVYNDLNEILKTGKVKEYVQYLGVR